MRKYENNRKIALGIIADAKEEFYHRLDLPFRKWLSVLKTEIEENWL